MPARYDAYILPCVLLAERCAPRASEAIQANHVSLGFLETAERGTDGFSNVFLSAAVRENAGQDVADLVHDVSIM